MLTSVYSGSMTASLAVNKATKPFDTLDELADDDEYIFLIVKGTFREEVFKVHKIYQYYFVGLYFIRELLIFQRLP